MQFKCNPVILFLQTIFFLFLTPDFRPLSDIDITELAEKYGDPEGQKVYLDGLNEIKKRWIDQAFAEWRRY